MLINHELVKLSFHRPAIEAFAVYAAMLGLAILSLRRVEHVRFMDIRQTNQLRGIAILLVVAGHINHLLLLKGSFPNFASLGVSLFLFCSGYGLTISRSINGFAISSFLRRRLSRIFLPYWLVTAIIITADVHLLGKTYSLVEIAATTVGVNLNETVRQIDYVRWYITLLLIMYVIFLVAASTGGELGRQVAVIWLGAVLLDAVIVGVGIRSMNRFVPQSLMFPLGATAALFRSEIERGSSWIVSRRWSKYGALCAPILALAANYFFSGKNMLHDWSILWNIGMRQLVSTIFIGCLLLFAAALVSNRVESRGLFLFGIISYELFLTHGVLLVKYDFLLYRKPFIVFYLLFLAGVSGISFGLMKLFSRRLRLTTERMTIN